MNLVDVCKGQLGGATLSQLAGALGMDPNDAKRAADAATPSLLAALSGVASTPDGAQRLETAVDNAHLPTDAMAAMSEPENFLERGTSQISSLLGGSNALSSLGGALGKFTGIGSGSIMTLLGALGPMILGVLKGQKQTLGLQSGGLANLLASQKSNIAAALPSGLGSMLGGAGIPGLSGVENWAKGAASRAVGATSDVGRTAYGAGRDVLVGAGRAAEAGASSAARWAIPLVLVLLVLAGLVWWLMSPTSPTQQAQTPHVPPSVANAVGEVKDTAKDVANKTADTANATLASAKSTADDFTSKLTSDTTDTFSGLTTSLGNITDPASADAVVPKLKELPDKLDTLRSSLGTLPDDSRAKMTSTIRPLADKLNAALDKAMGIPGVSDKIGPYVQPVRDKLRLLIPTT